MFYIGVNMAKKEKANGMAILNEQINKKEFSRVYLLDGTISDLSVSGQTDRGDDRSKRYNEFYHLQG